MAVGDLTATRIGNASISATSAELIDMITGQNLPATTDFLYLIPMSNGMRIEVLKVVRSAV